jgi:hypothetical protein
MYWFSILIQQLLIMWSNGGKWEFGETEAATGLPDQSPGPSQLKRQVNDGLY